MRQPVKQTALTVALTVPLALTALVSAPFSASTKAQGGAHMVGPQFPILLDGNGNGPGAGDSPVTPRPGGPTTLQLSSLFSCGTQQNNTVNLSNTDGSGKFRTFSRANNGRNQVLNVTNASGGQALGFSGTETLGNSTRASGGANVVDGNGDGKVDGLSMSSTNGSMLISLVFTPDSGYASIPVAQAVMLGAKQGDCGPAFSQIWVPLADTDGDGRGDTIVLDLDGDGIPDFQYYTSPKLGAIGVPTTSNLGLAVLTLLLGGTGVWYLGCRRLGDLGQA
jgi:hypothetical protein